MKTSKKLSLSNTTNSKLPDDQQSRIFIGNLNTNQISKKHVLKIFTEYGQIKAISIHKGYCFVQYFYKEHAKVAIEKMHGQLIGGQIVDVNLVTDPKPHQKKLNSESSESSKESIESELKIDSLLEELKNSTKETSTDHSGILSAESSQRSAELSNQKSNESLKRNPHISAHQSTKISSLHPYSKIISKRTKPQRPPQAKISLDTMSTIYEQYALTRTHLYDPYNYANKQFPVISNNTDTSSDLVICGLCKSVFQYPNNFDLYLRHKQSLCLFASTNVCITNSQ